MHYKKRWLATLIFPLMAACNGNNFVVNKNISVTLVANEHYQIVEQSVVAKEDNQYVTYLSRGEDIVYVVNVDSNYSLVDVSYEEADLLYMGENNYQITLFDVQYSLRCYLSLEEWQEGEGFDSEHVITYDPNGGEYLSNKDKIPYTTKHHPRPNTSIGTDLFIRKGYNLIGWNTKEDGSGEHIGLGSRYLDLNNSAFTLYAEWIKYSDVSYFSYDLLEKENKIAIKKYLGSEKIVSIPEYINDIPVSIIAQDAFEECACESVIFPKSIEKVEASAFNDCELKELYLYDNIVSIHDSCFVSCDNFSTVHINAIEGARYVDCDRHSPYADKIDNIIVNENKKKIVVMGGSGAYYSVDACKLKELYPDYEPFNVAINGWFNGMFQFEIVNHYMHEDDVFLHVVESCGKYQFMADDSMGDYDEIKGFDCRYMNCLELNYDLISLADIRHVSSFFDVFKEYNNQRSLKSPVPYTSYTVFADERGDYTNDPNLRTKHTVDGISISNEGMIYRGSYSEEGLNKLADYYSQFKAKGIKVFFCYACVNLQSLSEKDLSGENISLYEVDIENVISGVAHVINSINDVLFDSTYFADTDWHLDYEHALIYTEMIANWMGYLE